MPKLERGPGACRQPIEKGAEQPQILLEVGRQLEEENAELGAERVGGLHEVLQQLLAVLEPGGVSDALRRLQCELERLRRRLAPTRENFRVGRAIKGVVDLDRIEALRVVREHLCGGELLRIEAAP